jgi:hypothetical protein
MTLTRLLDYLPRGNLLDDTAWRKRHHLLLWILDLHLRACSCLHQGSGTICGPPSTDWFRWPAAC